MQPTPPPTPPTNPNEPLCEVIVVFGPRASGKTLNAAALKELFRCDHIHDGGLVPSHKAVIAPGRTLILEDSYPDAIDATWPSLFPAFCSIGAAAAALGDRWIAPIETRSVPEGAKTVFFRAEGLPAR